METSLPAAALPHSDPPALDSDAIGIRIKQLRALGNSPREIRATLTKAETDPERVQAILGIITRMEHQEQTRQSNKLVWALGILMVVVILLVGIGYIFQQNFLNQNQPVAAGAAGAGGQPGSQSPQPEYSGGQIRRGPARRFQHHCQQMPAHRPGCGQPVRRQAGRLVLPTQFQRLGHGACGRGSRGHICPERDESSLPAAKQPAESDRSERPGNLERLLLRCHQLPVIFPLKI